MDLSKNTIAVVDDDPDILLSIQLFLKQYFDSIYTYAHPNELLEASEGESIALVLLDLNYESGHNDGKEGITALETIKKQFKEAEVVVMTAYAGVDLAIEAIKKGAFDFVVKPWQNEKLLVTLINAIQKRSLQSQLLQKEIALTSRLKPLGPIVGESDKMQQLRAAIAQVGPKEVTVYLQGERGSGKELIAQHLHQFSQRSNRAFITIDFSLLNEKEQLKELFGSQNDSGKLMLAKGGTLFLKEIPAMTTGIQIQLLNALHATDSNIRIISSAHKTVEQKRVRTDLLEYLSLVDIEVPTLQERAEDLPDLLNYFLDQYCKQYQKDRPILSTTLFEDLYHYSWPFNVRELKRAVERIVAMDIEEIKAEHIIQRPDRTSAFQQDLSLESMEKGHIMKILQHNKGNIQLSARELGISRAALYRRIDKYQLKL